MPELLHETLAAFAAHLRDPAAPAPFGIEPKRLQLYRQLYINTLETLLSRHFPVLRRTLEPTAWDALVEGFARDHRARSPLFTEIGQEFIDYLSGLDPSTIPPWLTELAHYEWIELDLLIDPTPLPAVPINVDDPLTATLRLSPRVRLLGYRWPVHRIGPELRPDSPPPAPTWLLAQCQTGRVRFAELSPLAARLLTLLEHPDSGTGLLNHLADEVAPADRSAFMHEGAQLLRRLYAQSTILPN